LHAALSDTIFAWSAAIAALSAATVGLSTLCACPEAEADRSTRPSSTWIKFIAAMTVPPIP